MNFISKILLLFVFDVRLLRRRFSLLASAPGLHEMRRKPRVVRIISSRRRPDGYHVLFLYVAPMKHVDIRFQGIFRND